VCNVIILYNIPVVSCSFTTIYLNPLFPYSSHFATSLYSLSVFIGIWVIYLLRCALWVMPSDRHKIRKVVYHLAVQITLSAAYPTSSSRHEWWVFYTKLRIHQELRPAATSTSASDSCRIRRISCLDKPASLHRDRNMESRWSKRLRTVSNSATSPPSITRTRS
jgi:hypothetical protein